MAKRLAIGMLFGWLAATGLAHSAFPLSFSPPAPIAGKRIKVKFTAAFCNVFDPVTVIEGDRIRMTAKVNLCSIATPVPVEWELPFGPIPAGTYTFELYGIPDGQPVELLGRQELVVGAAPIPALSGLGLAVLGLLAALIGAMLIGRAG